MLAKRTEPLDLILKTGHIAGCEEFSKIGYNELGLANTYVEYSTERLERVPNPGLRIGNFLARALVGAGHSDE